MDTSRLLRGFFLDDLTLPWGTTLAQADVSLAGLLQWPPYGGWPNLHLACPHALGLATTSCNLRAPARHRPVLQANYKLAAPSGYSGQPTEAERWQGPLMAQLGPPTRAEVVEQPGAGGSNMVVYAAHWQAPGVRLSLSVYGGVRPEASGLTAASLFLDWEDELTAARPYAEAAAREAATLAAVVGPAVEPRVFTLAQAQAPYTHFNFQQPQPPSEERRRAQRALYREHLLETPPYFQQQLAAAEVALWPVPGQAAWAVSTRWDTLVLPPVASPSVELLVAQPGRGPGYVQLTIGTLCLTDALPAPALPALAAALAQLPGVGVSHRKDYDGW